MNKIIVKWFMRIEQNKRRRLKKKINNAMKANKKIKRDYKIQKTIDKKYVICDKKITDNLFD